MLILEMQVYESYIYLIHTFAKYLLQSKEWTYPLARNVSFVDIFRLLSVHSFISLYVFFV